MTRPLAALAVLAMVPAMIGPLPAARAGSLTVALCGGGAVSIPLETPPMPGSGSAPCCAKGCHNPGSRKRLVKTA